MQSVLPDCENSYQKSYASKTSSPEEIRTTAGTAEPVDCGTVLSKSAVRADVYFFAKSNHRGLLGVMASHAQNRIVFRVGSCFSHTHTRTTWGRRTAAYDLSE